jgi:predicted lipid-binding transport protein (Tim44 family)
MAVPSTEGVKMSHFRLTTYVLALAAGFAIVAADLAEARLGRGGSFGSRGTNTYKAPPQTNTAPKAAPIERSMTQKGSPTSVQNTPSGVGAAAQTSRFGGWRGLLMGGLFAAGLASVFGLGALASVLGFVLQFALIGIAVYLVVAFIRSRSQPAPAHARGLGGHGPREAPRPQSVASYGSAAASASAVAIGQTDLDTFEKLLGDIQTAYGREDIELLGAKTTPEMLSYFSQELADNAQQGVRNEVSDVKLLQGDLSEAWRENGSEYATVAMRFSLVDATVDRASGRVVSGNPERATEATELWTFRRDDRARADGWQLSAIQQAA